MSVLLSVIITAALLALSAAFMLNGKMTAGTERIIINVVRIIACLAGGFLCGKMNKKRGFLWGLLVGVIYYGLLVLLRHVWGGTNGDAVSLINVITTILCCAGSGMLGGMLS